MTAKIIDGKAIAEQNLNKLKKEIIERENKNWKGNSQSRE